MKPNKISFALICTLLATLACETSSSATSIPTFDPNRIQTAIVGTAQAAQTQTRAASTDTPTPTNTSLPADTPTPTETPTPLPLFTSTALPQPVTYEGTGNKIIDLPANAAGVLHVIANSESRFFGLKRLPEDQGDQGVFDTLIYMLAYSYDGRIPVNLVRKGMTGFRVATDGTWKITYYPLGSEYDHVLRDDSNLTFSGTSDDVWLSDLHANPEKVHVTWEQEDSYLSVHVIGVNGYHHLSSFRLNDGQMYWYETNMGEFLAIAVHAGDVPWKIKVYP